MNHMPLDFHSGFQGWSPPCSAPVQKTCPQVSTEVEVSFDKLVQELVKLGMTSQRLEFEPACRLADKWGHSEFARECI